MSNSLSKYLVSLKKILLVFNKHRLLGYIVFILILYIFLILKINNLDHLSLSNQSNSPTTSSAVATPQRINPSVVYQLQQLQNNSVSVQSLFQQARNNPF